MKQNWSRFYKNGEIYENDWLGQKSASHDVDIRGAFVDVEISKTTWIRTSLLNKNCREKSHRKPDT